MTEQATVFLISMLLVVALLSLLFSVLASRRVKEANRLSEATRISAQAAQAIAEEANLVARRTQAIMEKEYIERVTPYIAIKGVHMIESNVLGQREVLRREGPLLLPRHVTLGRMPVYARDTDEVLYTHNVLVINTARSETPQICYYNFNRLTLIVSRNDLKEIRLGGMTITYQNGSTIKLEPVKDFDILQGMYGPGQIISLLVSTMSDRDEYALFDEEAIIATMQNADNKIVRQLHGDEGLIGVGSINHPERYQEMNFQVTLTNFNDMQFKQTLTISIDHAGIFHAGAGKPTLLSKSNWGAKVE